MVSEPVLLRPAWLPSDDGFYVQVGKHRKKGSFISDLKFFISVCFNFPRPQVTVGEDGGVVVSGLYEGIPDEADYSHERFDHILDLVGWIEGCVEFPTRSNSTASQVLEEMLKPQEPLVVEIGSTLKSDEGLGQKEAKISPTLMKESSCFGARHMLGEMPKPVADLKTIEVSDLLDARPLLAVNKEFSGLIKSLKGLPVQDDLGFDPGGKSSVELTENSDLNVDALTVERLPVDDAILMRSEEPIQTEKLGVEKVTTDHVAHEVFGEMSKSTSNTKMEVLVELIKGSVIARVDGAHASGINHEKDMILSFDPGGVGLKTSGEDSLESLCSTTMQKLEARKKMASTEFSGLDRLLRKLINGNLFEEECKNCHKNLIKQTSGVRLDMHLSGSATCLKTFSFDPGGESLSTNGNSRHLIFVLQRKISFWSDEKNSVQKFKEHNCSDVLMADYPMLVCVDKDDTIENELILFYLVMCLSRSSNVKLIPFDPGGGLHKSGYEEWATEVAIAFIFGGHLEGMFQLRSSKETHRNLQQSTLIGVELRNKSWFSIEHSMRDSSPWLVLMAVCSAARIEIHIVRFLWIFMLNLVRRYQLGLQIMDCCWPIPKHKRNQPLAKPAEPLHFVNYALRGILYMES